MVKFILILHISVAGLPKLDIQHVWMRIHLCRNLCYHRLNHAATDNDGKVSFLNCKPTNCVINDFLKRFFKCNLKYAWDCILDLYIIILEFDGLRRLYSKWAWLIWFCEHQNFGLTAKYFLESDVNFEVLAELWACRKKNCVFIKKAYGLRESSKASDGNFKI